jgi:hypothetical protein
MKKIGYIALTITLLFSTNSTAQAFDAYHNWTSLLVKTYKGDNFSHKLYAESWNDFEEGQILWLVSNKFGYGVNKNLSLALNHSFLDVQAGNKKNSSAPHQHRFELEVVNKFKYLTSFSFRYRLENRFKRQLDEDNWDFRFRLKYTIGIPVFEKESGLSLKSEGELLVNNQEFGEVWMDFVKNANEFRWGFLSLGVKVNDKISVKLAPVIRFKKTATDDWHKTGVMSLMLINSF